MVRLASDFNERLGGLADDATDPTKLEFTGSIEINGTQPMARADKVEAALNVLKAAIQTLAANASVTVNTTTAATACSSVKGT